MPHGIRHPKPWLRAFWWRAYHENITGLSAMVAYNLMLAVFPFALLVLFVFGQVLKIGGVEAGVLDDLQRLFPNVEQGTLSDALGRIGRNATTIGIAAFAGSLWIGASFWGAMDTAFCRIYHVECRSWVEQKRFSFAMLVVVLLFIAASIFLPTIEATLVSSTDKLPFGLSGIKAIDTLLLLGAAVLIVFAICCVIFWAVPKGHMPWRAVWPGAVFVTVAAGIANCGAGGTACTNVKPTLDRTCASNATGAIAGTTLTWGACTPAPNGMVSWNYADGAAATGAGCATKFNQWGNIACTGSALICGEVPAAELGDSFQTWNQALQTLTFSSTTYKTATFTMPAMQIPNGTGDSVTTLAITSSTVVGTQCGSTPGTDLVCNSQ